jgi:ribosome-binding ATPase YchF (GTP1/OBG family)
MIAPGRSGAAALVDVAGYKNADALVHVVRAFRDPAVPHPSGSVDPARDAQAMEDELILADLGVVERRLERMEKTSRRTSPPSSTRKRICCSSARPRSKTASRCGRSDSPVRSAAPARLQLLSAKPLLVVINLDEADADAAASVDIAAERTAMKAFLSREGTRAVALCAKIELEIAALEPADAERFSRTWASPNRGSVA